MRCFIGIDLSVEATKEIERLQRIIKPHFVGKTTVGENLHLTLKFLGEIEDGTLNEAKKKLSTIIKYLSKSGIETKPIWYPNHLQRKYKNCQTYRI